jgi:hypothetical protein
MLALSFLMLLAAALMGCSCSGGSTQQATLVVAAFSPDQATENAYAPMRFVFDRPAVHENLVGRKLVQVPVEVHPPVKVAGHWLDRQTLVVKPLTRLASSTRYRVSLKGDLARRTGDREYAFVHRPLEVSGITGADPGALSPRPALTLRFNQPVKAADVVKSCSLASEKKEKQTIALLTPESDAVGSRVQVAPSRRLVQGQRYQLRCAGLAGWGGNAAMAEPYTSELRTYPALRVVKIGPSGQRVAADEVSVTVEFSTPVTLEQVRKNVLLWPAAKGFHRGSLDGTRTRYTATVNLRVTTGYAVRVRKGLTDVHGQTLARDRRHGFKTGDASPQLSLETGIYAVEARQGGYPVWSRNVKRFSVECAAVPRDGVVKLLTGRMDYDPWYDSSYGKGAIAWSKLGLRRRVKRIGVQVKKNKWELHNLRLNEICGGSQRHHAGLYLAQLRSREVERGLKEKLSAQSYFSFRYPFRVLANVTDLGVLVKAGTGSGLVWVTSLESGKPVSGARVTVYSPRGRKVHTGATDAQGVARLPGTEKLLRQGGTDPHDFDSWRAQRLIAVVEKGHDMAVVDGNWQNGIQIWNFGVPTDRKGGEKRVRGFIQSDRGIYRPGETVHFKGLVREIAVGRRPRVPDERHIRVLVKDARDATVLRRRLKLTPFGGFSFDLRLSREASLGDYRVTASIQRQDFVERFQVEEFRKVTYELKLKGARRHDRLGRDYKLKLDARYLFGAPVAGARVAWSVQRRMHQLHFAAFPGYAFQDYAAEGRTFWYWDDERDSYPTFVSDGEGETDDEGRFRFTFKDENRTITTPQDYLVQVTATDATDQSVSKRTVITAHRSDHYLGLHTQEFVQAVDMPFAVNTVALAPDGRQVAAGATLSYIRERYRCVKSGGGHRYYSTCKQEHQKIWSRKVSIPQSGVGTERIMPRHPGEYIVRLEGKDRRGNRIAASSTVWIIGKGEAFWSGDESARMSLVANKTEYEPGETARLVARGAFGAATALVTLERDGVLETRVTRVESSGEGIEVPVRDLHAPNVFASVALMRGRTGKGDRYRPLFKMGVVNLKVSPKTQRLRVELSTNRETYEPGTEVTGRIRVTGADGKPARAELSLSVADEGVLQLIAYKTPDPMKRFYAAWGLGIDTSTNLNRVARLNDPTDVEGEEPGGDGGGGPAAKVRSRFVSSAYWAAALVTDENGEVPFSFKAPDNLTAFRLMAVAADTGSRFGSGERRITIKKPLLAKPVLPRFLSAGDTTWVGVMVHNYTGAAGVATVSASASGLKLLRRYRRVRIENDGVARVSFAGKVGFARGSRVTFTVRMGQHSDALRLRLPVTRPMVIEKSVVGGGEVEQGGARVALSWPDDVLPRDSRLMVTVDRTGLGEMQESLRYLVRYPYGCLEQTLSGFIPLTKVKDLASSLEMRDLQGPRLRRFIRAGAAKVVRHQHASGHFSLWPSSNTYPHLTAYALYGLDEARRAGVRVPRNVLDRGATALRSWANGSDRTMAPGGEVATMAMAAYVLARLGKPDAGLNARLLEAPGALPRYGQAFLLRALKLSGAPAAQQKLVLDELLSAITVAGETAAVEEKRFGRSSFYMSSDVRSSAIVLSALLEVDPRNAVIPKLVEGLKRSRRPSGAWENTQDNIYALVALADFARQRTKGATRVTLRLGKRRLATARLSGGAILGFTRPLSELRQGELSIDARGKALYTVRLVLARRDGMVKAVDRGFKVEREYRLLGSDLPVDGKVKAGQLVRVILKVETPKDRDYVAVVAPLPAGFEAVNDRLATSQRTERRRDSSATRYRWYPSGYRPAGWVHRELRDDRVLAFADRLPAGRHVLDYVVRATIPGTFTVSPASAEAMYEPDVNGRTVVGKMEVTK